LERATRMEHIRESQAQPRANDGRSEQTPGHGRTACKLAPRPPNLRELDSKTFAVYIHPV